MTDEAKKPEDEQELIPVVDDEDGGDPAPAADPSADDPPAQDARLDHDADDDDDGDTVSTGDTEKDNANRRRRQQRRQAQKAARERQEHMLATMARENAELKDRLGRLEQHTVSSTLATVDARIARAESDAAQALDIHAAAIEAGNGKDAAAALSIREAALEEARQLKSRREQLAAEPDPQSGKPQPGQPQVDPSVVSHARSWVEANPWYDPNLGNDESKIAKQIDEQLVREGYNPATREHWSELTNRLNEVFAAAAGDDPAPADKGSQNGGRKGPPTSSTRETGGRQLKSNEIYVAPERKQAMMDAGTWDDPVRRQRVLKEYARFDAENTSR